MKVSSFKQLFIILVLNISLCFAQLPRQVPPKVRGFPGKRSQQDLIFGRNEAEAMYRLNNTFIPYHYRVEMRVILDPDEEAGTQFTAPGNVRIYGVNQERTSQIVLHANDLSINETTLVVTSQTAPKAPVEIAGFSKDESRDFFIIQLGREITPKESFEIFIEFEANMLADEKGLFYRTYETENGEKRYVAATQFQAVEARRMFPCFDEPDLKATFELTVFRKENYTTLSNTNLVSSTPDPEFPGWMVDRFARTVKMSPYLLAFGVTDYSYAEAFFGNKPARTYGPTHLIKRGLGKYSANVAAKCLNFYESFFNESYKLPKMDSVAIPGYSGAMENWGMNVYGTNFLLYFPGRDSEARRSLVTNIIAHELAHQWFGNLVTVKWWNEVFLNEGLSTYAQYFGMEAASPDFHALEYVILDAVQFSMLYDAGPNSHPMTLNVSTPDEIDGMFSTISYEKGASVFRMVEGVLTRKTMMEGLQNYMKKFAFKGVQQDDLYDSLQMVASRDQRLPPGLTMHDIMHTWTDQSGFPMVKVDVINETHVTLSQQKFVNDGITDLEGSWYIPITMVTQSKPKLEDNTPHLWLENDGLPVTIEHHWSSNDWIMINQNATGFFRTLYDENLHKLIQQQLDLDESVISPLSRSQLLDDYFVFSEEKYVNIQAALNLTRYLHKETHFTVWSTFFDHFSGIYEKFSSHPAYPLMRTYLLPKIDKALLAIGLEETPKQTGALAILRADLLDWSCSLESPLCKEYAGMLFAQWESLPKTNNPPIKSIDSRNTLLCAMVSTGGRPAFNLMFEKYKSLNDSRVRLEYLGALACATDEILVNEFVFSAKLLYKTLNTSSGLLPADGTTTLSKVALNPFGRILLLNFLSENIDQIIETIGDGKAKPIGEVLTTLATYFSTEVQLKQIQKFADEHEDKLESISTSVKSAIGLIKENIAWMDSTGGDVWMWLWFEAQHKNFV